MNAYWYPPREGRGPSIRLQDHWGEYLLRLSDQKTYSLVRYKGRVYAGEIFDSNTNYGIGEIGTGSGEPVVSVSSGSNHATDITDTPVAQGPGQYFGRIDGQEYPLRFVPVSESPEQKIEMVR